MLVLTTTDVDKSGESYYGEQHLYYLTVKGDGSMVPLGNSIMIISIYYLLLFIIIYYYLLLFIIIYYYLLFIISL